MFVGSSIVLKTACLFNMVNIIQMSVSLRADVRDKGTRQHECIDWTVSIIFTSFFCVL